MTDYYNFVVSMFFRDSIENRRYPQQNILVTLAVGRAPRP